MLKGRQKKKILRLFRLIRVNRKFIYLSNKKDADLIKIYVKSKKLFFILSNILTINFGMASRISYYCSLVFLLHWKFKEH